MGRILSGEGFPEPLCTGTIEALGYILFGGNVTELPEELKFYITKMLQEDLETDEESLEVLVNMAREKISVETLNNELDLKMQLIKIEEKK